MVKMDTSINLEQTMPREPTKLDSLKIEGEKQPIE